MSRKAGLSYLELLIVLMLLAITAILIGGAFDFVRQAKTRAIAFEAQEEPIILRGLLREWVENMSPVVSENQFEGTSNGFGFTMASGLQAIPAANSIRVQFNLGEDITAFVGLLGTNAAGSVVLEETRSFEPRLETASFSYYGAKAGLTLAWHEAWDHGKLPKLIRFQATRSDGSEMPPLIIRPAVAYNQSLISVLFPSPPT